MGKIQQAEFLHYTKFLRADFLRVKFLYTDFPRVFITSGIYSMGTISNGIFPPTVSTRAPAVSAVLHALYK